MEIKGRTIVITGASQGLGRSMAMMFARQGAQLALADITEDKLKDAARQCRETGADARAYTVDVTDETAVEHNTVSMEIEDRPDDAGRID